MVNDRNKLLIFLLLFTGFLSYSFIIYTTVESEGIVVSTEAAQGKLLWQKYNCGSCHQFYGLGGHLGPDLTNVYSKRSPEYISAFLKTGTPVMPNFHLSETEIKALLSFLEQTNASGSADPRTYRLKYDGTIIQD
jgi:nitric oxide reductase subunit C